MKLGNSLIHMQQEAQILHVCAVARQHVNAVPYFCLLLCAQLIHSQRVLSVCFAEIFQNFDLNHLEGLLSLVHKPLAVKIGTAVVRVGSEKVNALLNLSSHSSQFFRGLH